MTSPRAAIRCTAHRSTDGQPCSNFAMHGGWVCHAHGGKIPAVRAVAERRLAERRLQKERRAAEAALKRELAETLAKEAELRRAEREAIKPWEEVLGPRYLWDWHSPQMLRRIAAEMRRAATELTKLASTADERQTPCTGS
jgi:hypothetical protein